ncbi:MAG: nucleotide exchange factor GrpE [Actinomycetota bacterium]|nr:nucleotide exchange factor GrpE [Actinomycetota bacterium]
MSFERNAMDDQPEVEPGGELPDEALEAEGADEYGEGIGAEGAEELSLTQLVDVLTAERDEYLRALQLTKADFDNYRRRMQRMEAELQDRKVISVFERLLPKLDDLNSLYLHKLGTEDEDVVTKTVLPLFAALASEGLDRIEATGVPFDPELHQAVLHEDGDDGPVVAEVMRVGYAFKGRTLRPAMVKVVG